MSKFVNDNRNKRSYLLLHGGFLLYSFSAVLSKVASNHDFLSFFFLFFWGLALAILVVYALLWQIILQRFPLSRAFANRGVVVIWGIIWGFIIFGEQITIGKVLAMLLILVGIVVIGKANE